MVFNMINNYKAQYAANMELTYEFQDVTRCLGKLIELAEQCDFKDTNEASNEFHTQTVHLFVRSIFAYIHEAHDCLKTGKFYATNMLLRTILKNYFLLTAIDQNPDIQLAEFWQLHSVLRMVDYLNLSATEKNIKLNEYALSLDLDPDYILWKKLDSPYGWLYPLLSGKLNLYALCETLGEEYLKLYNNDYRKLCEYAHGGSYFQKERTFTFDTSYTSMLVLITDYLMRIVRGWCDVDSRFEKQFLKLTRMMNTNLLIN